MIAVFLFSLCNFVGPLESTISANCCNSICCPFALTKGNRFNCSVCDLSNSSNTIRMVYSVFASLYFESSSPLIAIFSAFPISATDSPNAAIFSLSN